MVWRVQTPEMLSARLRRLVQLEEILYYSLLLQPRNIGNSRNGPVSIQAFHRTQGGPWVLGENFPSQVEVIEIKQLTLMYLIKHMVDHWCLLIWRITDCSMNIFFIMWDPNTLCKLQEYLTLLYLNQFSSLMAFPSCVSKATLWNPNKLDL